MASQARKLQRERAKRQSVLQARQQRENQRVHKMNKKYEKEERRLQAVRSNEARPPETRGAINDSTRTP